MKDELKDKLLEGSLAVFIIVFALCGIVYTVHIYIIP